MPTVALKFRFKKNQKVKTFMAACALIQQPDEDLYRAREVSLASAGGEAKVHEALAFISRYFGFGWVPTH